MKFRHCLIPSKCIVACQEDMVKYMLQRLVLSGRIGKLAYALVEYDLEYQLSRAMKGKIVADFITDRRVDVDQERGESMEVVL